MPDLTDEDRKFAREWASAQVPPVTPTHYPETSEWVWECLVGHWLRESVYLAQDSEDAAWSALAAALAPIRRSLEPVLTDGLRDQLRQQCEDEAENERALAAILYGPDWPGEEGVGMSVLIERVGAELGRLKTEVQQLESTVIDAHSCHEDCQRQPCVLRRENRKLKARLAELETAGAWRPIDEAPKDRAFVGYNHLWGRPQVRECHYREGEWIAYDYGTGWYQVGIPPSHWNDFPAPPPRTT